VGWLSGAEYKFLVVSAPGKQQRLQEKVFPTVAEQMFLRPPWLMSWREQFLQDTDVL